MKNRLVVISGCSGGGKSTLLAELERRGHPVVAEPGRRIVSEETARGGRALPWLDLAAFLRRAIDMAQADLAAAAGLDGWVFFDRSLVDAAAALQALTGQAVLHSLCAPRGYHQRVFMAPPWRDIYATDAARQHDFEAAVAEYDRLMAAFPALGYEVIALPRTTTAQRADFILATLGALDPAGP